MKAGTKSHKVHYHVHHWWIEQLCKTRCGH